jgi:hypothetical protein
MLGADRYNRELKRGSAELLVLSFLEGRPRHGYEIGKLIEVHSKKWIQFRIASLNSGVCFGGSVFPRFVRINVASLARNPRESNGRIALRVGRMRG